MKSLLVVEAGSHPKVLENQNFLFRNSFKVSFMTIPDKRNSYHHMMPSIIKENKLKCSIHSTSIFLELLFIGFLYDYIHISTGPESKHFSNLWTRPLYYLCTLIYGKKIILTIKNSRAYLSEKSYFTHLLYKSLSHVKLVMFETSTLRDYFVKAYGKKLETYIIYDRYTDLLSHKLLGKTVTASPPYRIGLLGSLNNERRDYAILVNSLSQLSREIRNQFHFYILGECRDGHKNVILQSLQRHVDVSFPDGYLSADDFDEIGVSCHILISPLSTNYEYGTFKGSGSFGDAIYLRKRILIPSFVDPQGEFSDISFYYSNESDLTKLLGDLSVTSFSRQPDQFYNKFSTSKISEDLSRILLSE